MRNVFTESSSDEENIFKNKKMVGKSIRQLSFIKPPKVDVTVPID